MINIETLRQKEHSNMLKLILSLLGGLRNRSQLKTKTNVKVDVQQKITVVRIEIHNER